MEENIMTVNIGMARDRSLIGKTEKQQPVIYS